MEKFFQISQVLFLYFSVFLHTKHKITDLNEAYTQSHTYIWSPYQCTHVQYFNKQCSLAVSLAVEGCPSPLEDQSTLSLALESGLQHQKYIYLCMPIVLMEERGDTTLADYHIEKHRGRLIVSK